MEEIVENTHMPKPMTKKTKTNLISIALAVIAGVVAFFISPHIGKTIDKYNGSEQQT